MAEDLLDTIGQVFGPVRGGLAYAVIFVGALLAATTGVVAASVISMGLISLPIMLRYGYEPASGLRRDRGLGDPGPESFPPALVLIIPANQLGKSLATCIRAPSYPGSQTDPRRVIPFSLIGGQLRSLTRNGSSAAAEALTMREPDDVAHRLALLVLAILAAALLAAVGLSITRPNRARTRSVRRLIVITMLVAVGQMAFPLRSSARKLRLLSRMAERVTFVLIPPLPR